ncbi:MAG: site-specific DNA-methyltransferase [Nanoarchaeota archaeon]|nr:site-specific DNA-methyltransferase [Nanoarchaeota archaeon]
MNIKEAMELKELVTFIPNKHEPIHNWYYYKEGYSKAFVELMIKKFNIQKNHVVLDPFCGIGTTNLTCKQNGIKSIGFDVSPLCTFVSRVKTTDYDLEDLEKKVKQILGLKFEKPEYLPKDEWLRRSFNRYVLEDIMFYKKNIFQIDDGKAMHFLLLGLMDSAMSCSYAYKDGALVRIQKKHVPPLGKFFKYKMKKMLKDLEKTNVPNVETKIELGDARDLAVCDDGVDFIITSPPYLNKIEYTKIYRTEYALFFQQPKTQIRSFIEEGEDAYFRDMRKCLENFKRVCKGQMAIVIGGGCFPDHVTLVDEKIGEIAEDIGLKVKEILVARNSWCTKARTVKVGQIRESVVILE